MCNVVNSKMEPSESFLKFANCVIAGNNLLEGTDIRLDTEGLRKTLLGNMSEFLASMLDRIRTAERDRLAGIESFEEWMAEIVLIDHEATSNLKWIAEMLRGYQFQATTLLHLEVASTVQCTSPKTKDKKDAMKGACAATW